MRELNEDTKLQLSIKTIIGIAVALSTLIGMWFALQADIEEAKELLKVLVSVRNHLLLIILDLGG